MWICSVVVVLASAATAYETSNKCECHAYDNPPHPQVLYRDAAFCVKGKVISGSDEGYLAGTSVTRYTVKVKDVFKGTECHEGETIDIYSMHAACYVALEVGKNYLLCEMAGNPRPYMHTGPRTDNMYWINQCGYNGLWKDVSLHQRNALKKRYVANMECTGMCEMDPNIPTICYYRYATCQIFTKDYQAGCKWVKGIGGGFGKCVKEYINTYPNAY